MEQKRFKIDPDKLCCSICSELLRDPVTISCGHSYCKLCINRHWDQEKRTKQKALTCPLCRTTFPFRTVLVKNTVLADLVEDLRKTDAAVDHCCTGTHDTAVAAVVKRSASPSSKSPLKRQKLLEQENMCSKHSEKKNIFCRTERQCICYLCHLDDHRGHDTVSAESEMTERTKELEASRHRTVQAIQGIGQDMALLQQKLKDWNQSADKVVSENENLAAHVKRLIEEMSSDLTLKIRQKQKTAENKIQELLRRKQEEKDLHQQRLGSSNLEQLFQRMSYTEFLEKYTAVSQFGELPGRTSIQGLIEYDFQNLSTSLSREKYTIKDTCTNSFRKVTQMVLSAEPQYAKSDGEFYNYLVQLTLDPSTASVYLELSEDNRKVTSVEKALLYPPYLERFQGVAQVLSMDPLPACCYWEVDWTGLNISVGVAYNDIQRDGPYNAFGNNDKSWVLDCGTKNNSYVYRHNGKKTVLTACETCRVGVFLDRKAGNLCFYEVSKTNRLLYKVKTTFTQPLYAGLGVYSHGATAKMCVKERGARDTMKR